MTGQFTGKHMAMVMGVGFGIVIAVNLVMATFASTTFGGVVVENSYVASQKFNGWLDEAERARALGWEVNVARSEEGNLLVETANVPPGAEVLATARHPLGRQQDRLLHFAPGGEGAYLSRENLSAGRWTLRLEIRSDGDIWRGERDLR